MEPYMMTLHAMEAAMDDGFDEFSALGRECAIGAVAI
jgi:hypothetical protein